MVKQCLFFWNGREADGGGNFTLQPGEFPSAATLRFRLSYQLDDYGTLTLTDGYQVRQFRGCRISRRMITAGEQGRWQEVTILDRRWRWGQEYSAVYGEYNRVARFPRDYVNPKSYRELATYCFQALGEVGFDVSILPHYYRDTEGMLRPIGPRIAWDAAPPADELQAMCQQIGCEVVLGTDDRARVVRSGVGRLAFSRDPRFMDYQTSSEPPVIPAAVVGEGGATRVQHDWPLEAVGWEVDGDAAGQFIPIDDLSYRPTDGWEWETISESGFFGAGPGLNESKRNKVRKLARKYIFKAYRVGGRLFTDSVNEFKSTQLPIPPTEVSNRSVGSRLSYQQRRSRDNYFRIDRGEWWRVLPLFDTQLDGWAGKGNEAGAYEVLGHFHDVTMPVGKNNSYRNTAGSLVAIEDHSDITSNNPNAFDFSKPIEDIPTPANSTLVVPWQSELNIDNGLIFFEQYTYFRNVDVSDPDAGKAYPAVIRLRTSSRLRDPTTAAHLCQQYWVQPGGNSVKIAKIEKNSDIFFAYGLWGRLGNTQNKSNKAEFVEKQLQMINKTLNMLRYPRGASAPAKGFVFDFSPDGIIRAVSFDVAETGEGTTTIDWGSERPDAYTQLDNLRRARFATYNLWLRNEVERKKNAGIIR